MSPPLSRIIASRAIPRRYDEMLAGWRSLAAVTTRPRCGPRRVVQRSRPKGCIGRVRMAGTSPTAAHQA